MGVVVAGVIVDAIDWRWILQVKLPVAVAVLVVLPRMLEESRPEPGSTDLPGAVSGSTVGGLGRWSGPSIGSCGVVAGVQPVLGGGVSGSEAALAACAAGGNRAGAGGRAAAGLRGRLGLGQAGAGSARRRARAAAKSFCQGQRAGGAASTCGRCA